MGLAESPSLASSIDSRGTVTGTAWLRVPKVEAPPIFFVQNLYCFFKIKFYYKKIVQYFELKRVEGALKSYPFATHRLNRRVPKRRQKITMDRGVKLIENASARLRGFCGSTYIYIYIHTQHWLIALEIKQEFHCIYTIKNLNN